MKEQGLDEGRKFVGLLSGILQIVAPIFTLFSVSGLVIGLFLSYDYLSKIGYLSIFPDILSQPSVLGAVLMPIFIYSILYIWQLLSPYCFYLVKDDEWFKKENNINALRISISNFIIYIIFVCYFFQNNVSDLKCVITVLPVYYIFLFSISSFLDIPGGFKKCIEKVKNNNIKSFKKSEIKKIFMRYFTDILNIIASIIFYNISLGGLYVILSLAQDNRYVVNFTLILTHALMSFFAYDSLKSSEEEFSNAKGIISIFCFIFYIIFMFLLLASYSFGFKILYAPRLIEEKEDSSWYLLHNPYGQELTNGMSFSDIAKIKQEFSADKNSKDKSEELEKNPNALYGYMAWNAGRTKIFCPYSFDNKDKDKEQKCLVIDVSNLQPVPHFYFK